MMSTKGSNTELKVALIHDELVRRGGAEVVFEEFIRLFPQADVFALYSSNNPYLTIDGRRYDIHTSSLQQLPLWFRRHPSRLLPFLPHAAEQFDFSAYDLVISSSSGFAKGIITRSSIPHICYCHTPTRYVWDATHEATKRANTFLHWPLVAVLHYLRLADFSAAQRPDIFLANSFYTKQRIERYYRRPSTVVYPPINTQFFTPLHTASDGLAPFVMVGRLTPNKHFEQAIAVCNKLRLPLTIIGVGRDMSRLKQLAGPHITFLGKVTPEEMRSQIRAARAFLQPGIEDFGMAAAEALACGTPVIAYDGGGIKEIMRSGTHGILYSGQRAESLAEAMRQFMAIEHRFQASELQSQAMKFSTHLFREAILGQAELALRGTGKYPYTAS